MKTQMMILAFCSFCVSYSNAQDTQIAENISNARLNNGAEFFEDGSVKVVVNLNLIDFYYEWSKTADSAEVKIEGWDSSSLRNYLEAYYSKSQSLDFSDELANCKLIANELRQKSMEILKNEKEVASTLK